MACLAAVALAVTALAGPATAAPEQTPAGPAGPAASGGARTATVMTRNLYLGAELGSILAALSSGDTNAVVAAATRTWGQAVASQPEARMAALADEIVAERPHAVGLQEVTEFTTYDYDPSSGRVSNPTEAYDFLDLLLTALSERGASYRVVSGATAVNFTSPPIPIVAGAPYPTKAVQLQDRDVIIVRDDVTATNARNGDFATIISQPLPIARGWGSADLTVGKAQFRLVNTHLEAFDFEQLRVAQVGELFAAQSAVARESGALPSVYAGDFNSPTPDGGGYRALLAGGLHDLWTTAPPGRRPAQGDTCCQRADLRNAGSLLDERIDLLLGSPGVKALQVDRTGDEPLDLPGGVRWASDHAGVVADVLVRPDHGQQR